MLAPHIDFGRGGPTYTWAHRELAEAHDASALYIILGVAHQFTRNRFVLTQKEFETPLGRAYTDREAVGQLASLAGEHLFDDELAHRTEHSIEFQVVFLQHALGRPDVRILPILVGSFHDLLEAGRDPIDDPEVERFVDALKHVQSSQTVGSVYLGSIDLSHVGPEFGDARPLDRSFLESVRRFDAALLDRASAGDPAGWFDAAARVEDRYRVCGLAATYTLLHAIGPCRGRLLRYDQAVDPFGRCGVTFASLALDAAEPVS